MQVKISQAIPMIVECLKAKLVPFVQGSPGMGKSQIVHSIAKDFNLNVIDLRLSQCDPTDLMGFPNFVNGRATYAPMDTFPLEGDALPEGFNGWLIFLDEFNSASIAVQAAAYKLVLDRMIGQTKLHPNVAIVCAGNKEDDGAIVQTMSTALQSRLVHMELIVDVQEWLDWAAESGIDHRITDFIKFKPSALYTFSPVHTDKTYACPRTWEFANRFMAQEGTKTFLPLLAGTLSEGVAREFVTFCKIYRQLPKIENITKDPLNVPVPVEPSILYALTGSLANTAEKDSFDSLMKFIKRLPDEFQVVTLREVTRRNRDMLSHPAIREWLSNAATEYFS